MRHQNGWPGFSTRYLSATERSLAKRTLPIRRGGIGTPCHPPTPWTPAHGNSPQRTGIGEILTPITWMPSLLGLLRWEMGIRHRKQAGGHACIQVSHQKPAAAMPAIESGPPNLRAAVPAIDFPGASTWFSCAATDLDVLKSLSVTLIRLQPIQNTLQRRLQSNQDPEPARSDRCTLVFNPNRSFPVAVHSSTPAASRWPTGFGMQASALTAGSPPQPSSSRSSASPPRDPGCPPLGCPHPFAPLQRNARRRIRHCAGPRK